MLVLSIFSRWDAEAEQRLHSLDGHRARVGALSWNQHWLSSGGRDSTQPDADSASMVRCPTIQRCLPTLSICPVSMDFVIADCFGFDNGGIIVESTSQSFFRASIRQWWHHRRVRESVVLPNPSSEYSTTVASSSSPRVSCSSESDERVFDNGGIIVESFFRIRRAGRYCEGV